MNVLLTIFIIFYHFIMRIVVGEAITLIYKKREFNYGLFWFREKSFEKNLYKFLKVKKWKLNVITAKPYQFDITKRTNQELLHNITQAEVVHEIIMLLSFVPVVLIKWYSPAWIFILTSFLSSCIDCVFVLIQRFNRPRILKIMKKEKVWKEQV